MLRPRREEGPPRSTSPYRFSVAEADIEAEKRLLRQGMRRARSSLPPEERGRQAQLVERRLLELAELGAAGTVLLFYAFGSEVATAGMIRHLAGVGKRVLLPYLASGAMDAAEILPEEPLVPTGYGPREPNRRVAVEPDRIDLVVAPGLAFDRAGHRLGYGGGHYDRYLARLRTETPRIGIGFSVQLVDRVPVGALDQRLDLVVTDAEVVRCDPPRIEGPTV